MTSWRDSSDPRCPECGGKITATASYCMHCEADFDDDDSDTGSEYPSTVDSDVSSEDDVNYGTGGSGTGEISGAEPEIDFSTGEEPDVGIESNEQTSVGIESNEQTGVGIESNEQTDVGVESSGIPDIGFGSDDGNDVDMDAAEEKIEKTSLLLRGPVSVIVAFPAAVLFFFGSLAGNVPGSGTLVVFLLGWIGVSAYLLRKPLASDAIGDAFYVYAGTILLIPPIWVVSSLIQFGLGSSIDITETIITAIVFEVFLLFPAGFFLLIGYGANYYAKQKIEAALGERSAESAG